MKKILVAFFLVLVFSFQVSLIAASKEAGKKKATSAASKKKVAKKRSKRLNLRGSKPKMALANILLAKHKLSKKKVVVGHKKEVRKVKSKLVKKGKKGQTVRVTVPILADPAVDVWLKRARKETKLPWKVSSGYRSVADQKRLARHNGNAAKVSGPLKTVHPTGMAVDVTYKHLSKKQRAKAEAFLDNEWRSGRILPTKELYQACYHIVVLPKSQWQLNKTWVKATLDGNDKAPIIKRTKKFR